MKELRFFNGFESPEICVALPGISRLNWVCVKHNTSNADAVKIMKKNEFDVLPIKDVSGKYSECFKTKSWGVYSSENVERSTIEKEDRIYYRTNIFDAIKALSEMSRKFYFIDNQTEVIGLITVANLNSNYVYLAIYNLISQLEISLADFVRKHGIKNDHLMKFADNSQNPQLRKSLESYRRDSRRGLNFDFIEYLYLSSFQEIFIKFKLVRKLKLETSNFGQQLKRINKVRTVIAHPNRSLVTSERSVLELHNTLQDIEILLEMLKK